IEPIESRIPADRQGAKRHYGVHPYFTRRPYNVVREYILRYSVEKDRVLDPFGGSGVTAIEAFLENRVGIHNDINPLANFIAQGIADLAKGDVEHFREALRSLENQCKNIIDEIYSSDESHLERIRKTVHLPENVSLPKTSDVKNYHELFSRKQLISLAVIKDAIESIVDENARKGMLLAWSATLTKLNKTFLSAEGRAESRGGSSIFSIYRYKVAKEPIELPPWETFHERALNVIKAKIEITKLIEIKEKTGGWRGRFLCYSEDVESLGDKLQDSVDYIFTDPPYGGHISYLDLSTLWNSWLGFSPEPIVREKELIVGGELDLSEARYIERLSKSIEACVKMLKEGRWLSIVFQHWNTSYFEAILSSAAGSGAELKAAVSQIGDPIWSMHKKKNKDSVLAGEMILTFCKTGKVKRVLKNGKFDVAQAAKEILASAKEDKVYGEYIFNRIVIEAWKKSAIQSLNLSKIEFTDLLQELGWHYDEANHIWAKRKCQPGSLFQAF
ncbi:MAG TPA: DNA methyltransferase, partial [Blastocatellia bacterium]|nr:DNA methyltransferase [Blastocatellia bacterium]